MNKIIEVIRFQTTDNEIFENYDKAEKHQINIEKEKEVVDLLGGNNLGSGFTNGDGVYIVNPLKLEEAEIKIELFKKERGLENYDIKSRRAYEDTYLNTISHIISCIFQNDNNEYIRVGQLYFKNNRNELGSIIYK